MKKIVLVVIILGILLLGCSENSKREISEIKDEVVQEIIPPPNYLLNIDIDPKISEEIDSSKIIQELGLNENLKNKIKKILSDANADSDNLSGKPCGDVELKCKWDNVIFIQNRINRTIKSRLEELLLSPFTAFSMGMAIAIGGDEVKSEFKAALLKSCFEYENGNKYTCEEEDGAFEFCSLKCEAEYKNSL
jgi:hypothetical protein